MLKAKIGFCEDRVILYNANFKAPMNFPDKLKSQEERSSFERFLAPLAK
jgi:hypothetical protein